MVVLGEDDGGLRLLGLVVSGGVCVWGGGGWSARADARRVWVWFDLGGRNRYAGHLCGRRIK